MQLRDLFITYFYVIHKYSHTKKYGLVLDYTIKDSKHEINLREYWTRFHW